MYMRIIWGRTSDDGWRHIESNYRSLADRDVDGLNARWLVRDDNDPDSFFGITLWEDRSFIEKWEQSDEFTKVFLPAIRPYMTGSRSLAVCSVVFAKMFTDFKAN